MLSLLSLPLLLAAAALPCGQPTVDARDGRSYRTTTIGSQCWMAENLDHGQLVRDGVPENASAVERSCYGNDAASCRVYGGLYTWNEAQQLDRLREALDRWLRDTGIARSGRSRS